MSVTLEPVFNALGYETPVQQRGVIKLLQAAGAFGKLPGVDGVINDRQADAILHSVTFDDVKQAGEWLHDLTQETMKRPEGVARSNTAERADFNANREALVTALKEAGVLSEAKPKLKSYDHVLLLGSKEPNAETRLDTIKQLWEEGTRFGKVHLLGNERHLDASEEPIAKAPGNTGETLSTETQMLKARYYDMRTQWPVDLQKTPTFAVNSYDRDDPNTPSKTRPANTRETIETWLSANPNPRYGDVLVISNQPYVAYQDAAVKSVLPSAFHVETVGAGIDEKHVNITLAMDALARQIDVNFDKMLEKAAHPSNELKTSFALLDPATIKTAPHTYQFRSNFDGNSGVTQKGKLQTDHWDPILHGDPLLVHERLDGSVFVADGHHRLELAQRLNQEGHGPGNIAAVILREADGYTAEDVKIIAAYKNIAHGKDDPIETARVFKEAYSGRVHTEWLPQLQMDKGNLHMSFTLSKLSTHALDRVAKNDIPVEMAAEVAARIADPKGQEAVLDVIEEQLHHTPRAEPKPQEFTARFNPRKPTESFASREQKHDPAGKSFADQITSRNNSPSAQETITR